MHRGYDGSDYEQLEAYHEKGQDPWHHEWLDCPLASLLPSWHTSAASRCAASDSPGYCFAARVTVDWL